MKLDLTEVGWRGRDMDWINLAQDMDSEIKYLLLS
jgi:hypothetical protein